MTLGTIVVVAVLALIVGAIMFSQFKAKKAGVNPNCSGCGGCKGGCHSHEEGGDSSKHAHTHDHPHELLQKKAEAK